MDFFTRSTEQVGCPSTQDKTNPKIHVENPTPLFTKNPTPEVIQSDLTPLLPRGVSVDGRRSGLELDVVYNHSSAFSGRQSAGPTVPSRRSAQPTPLRGRVRPPCEGVCFRPDSMYSVQLNRQPCARTPARIGGVVGGWGGRGCVCEL